MAAGSLSYPVRTPAWDLFYRGKNITTDLAGMMISITYKDGARKSVLPWVHHKHRQRKDTADEFEISLEDRDRRWQGRWAPKRGDTVHGTIGYLGEDLLNCGNFEVDEIELKGPPDVVTIKCLATGIKPSLRTPRSAAYESMTLMQVAQTVAARHNLVVTGLPEDINVSWQRLTQHHETDLHFLRVLAQDHGYDFSVRGQQLVFYSRTHLEHRPSATSIYRNQIKTFEFRTQAHQVSYKSARVSWMDPFNKHLIVGESDDAAAPTSDVLNMVERVENEQQAKLKASSGLHDANMLATTARIETEGDVLLVAGINVQIQGFGTWDGVWHVDGSRHKLERSSGYETEIEVRKL